jgi:ribose transport system substrate-binding protein
MNQRLSVHPAKARWRAQPAIRLAATSAVVVAALVLSACGSSGSGSSGSSGSSSSNSGKGITIGFVPENVSNAFFVSMHYGAEQEAKVLGVHLVFQGTSGTPTPTNQLPYVNAVLAEHPSALVLGPTDPSALMPSVEQAHSSGIPVVTVDTTVSDTSLLASRITVDNVGGGGLAAGLLNTALGGKGQVYVMFGSPSFTTENLRLQGFKAKLPHYPGLKYEGFVDTNDVASNAETDTAHVLSRFPSLRGIFAVSDFIASGVVSQLASDKKGSQVKVVAYDAEPDEVTAMRKGQLTGLVAQRAAVEGSLAVLYAYDAATHHTANMVKSVILPDVLLTPSTLANSSKWFYCSSLSSCSGAWQPTKANGAP